MTSSASGPRSGAALSAMLAPSPQTRRGYGIQVHSSRKLGQFLYCNGKNVIIRSLSNPSQSELFSDHKCNVNVAKFSPNSEWVASGDSRGRILIWALGSKMIKIEVQVCRDVLDLCWSDDGKRVIGVGDGSGVYAKAFLWDSGSNIGEITNHSKSILSVDIRQQRPYRVVTAAEDRQVNFYQGPPFKFEKMNDHHSRYPNQVRFSPDGQYLVSVSSDKSIFLFDGSKATFIKDLTESGSTPNSHQGSIWSLAWAPDSKHIITVSGDSTAKIWSIPDGQVVQTFPFPSDGTSCHQQVGCLWHDESTLLTVSLSGSINWLDRQEPARPRQVARGHSVPVTALAVDQSSRYVYSGDSIGSVFRWNPFSNEIKELIDVGEGGKNIADLCLSPDTNQLYSVAFDDALRLNLSVDGCDLGAQPVSIVAGPDQLVIVATKKKTLAVISQLAVVHTTDLSFTPTAVALSPDYKEVAVSGTKSVMLYNLNQNTLTYASSYEKHTENTTAVAYSPDGRYLCSTDGQRSIYIWNRATGQVCNSSGWRYHSAKVTSVSFSPDSRSLASASTDQSILVFTDLNTFNGERIKVDPAHVGGVSHVKFIDDKHLISTGDDRAVKLWKLS